MKAKFKDATPGATLWIKDHGPWKSVTVTEVRKGVKGGPKTCKEVADTTHISYPCVPTIS